VFLGELFIFRGQLVGKFVCGAEKLFHRSCGLIHDTQANSSEDSHLGGGVYRQCGHGLLGGVSPPDEQ
jgi:hypothetical protein